MCSVLLIGTDTALLEGLAQTLASAGHRARIATELSEAAELALAERPLLAVVERRIAAADGAELLRLALAPGGSIVLYRDAADGRPSLAPQVERATLADLALPLERQRLVALVQHVETRARITGRGRISTPIDSPRVL